MKSQLIVHVVGARPNFMKVAPVIRALANCEDVSQKLVHTGQHYDVNMSDVFFQQLEIPKPDFNLAVGSGTQTTQTAQIMLALEPVLSDYNPDIVLIYGDVNSTLATALVCAKLLIPVGHIEAGLRSFDSTMPEEINRLVSDRLSHWLFTPSSDANENLLLEGVDANRIHFVGNVMIDTLTRLLPRIDEIDLGAIPERFALVTLHRPSNVDILPALQDIMNVLIEISYDVPIIFPVHPRTRQKLRDIGITFQQGSRLELREPASYLEFVALQRRACVVITDSGGVQEETTFLGIPCLTLRPNTERPVTASIGTNKIIGQDTNVLKGEIQQILLGHEKKGRVPPLWDGKTSERIAEILVHA